MISTNVDITDIENRFFFHIDITDGKDMGRDFVSPFPAVNIHRPHRVLQRYKMSSKSSRCHLFPLTMGNLLYGFTAIQKSPEYV